MNRVHHILSAFSYEQIMALENLLIKKNDLSEEEGYALSLLTLARREYESRAYTEASQNDK
jgi:hypothetical protein